MANQRALTRPKAVPAFFGQGDLAQAEPENAVRFRSDVRPSP
jgi:hypothetical protein